MKTIARVVGSIVLIVVLACGILYFMNERGWLNGSLADLVDSVTGHVLGIKDDTEDYLKDEGFLPSAVPSAATAVETPFESAEPTAETTKTPD